MKKLALVLGAVATLVLVAWFVVPAVYIYWYTPHTPVPFTDFTMVTRAEYEGVATGMTYEEVCKVIESKGAELSRATVGDMTTVIYQWQNPDRSNMNATFQDGVLVAKAQFGLR